jgi:hypothetical protein
VWVLELQAPTNLNVSTSAPVAPNSVNVYTGAPNVTLTFPGSTANTVAAPAPYVGCRITVVNVGTGTITIANATISASGANSGGVNNTVRPGKSATFVYETIFVSLIWYPSDLNLPASPVYNVLSYGADASGSGDSTAAIQQAINEAGAAGGGTVFFPPGTYGIISPINIGNATTFQAPFLSLSGGVMALGQNGFVTAMSGNGTTVTVTTTAQLYQAGGSVTLQSLTGTWAPFNGTYTIATIISNTQFTITNAFNPGGSATGSCTGGFVMTGFATKNVCAVYTGELISTIVTYTGTSGPTLTGCVPASLSTTAGNAVTAGSISTINNVTLLGAAPAGFPANGAPANSASTIKWNGAANLKMFNVLGPVTNIVIENLFFQPHGANVAGYGVYMTGAQACILRNNYVDRANIANYLMTGLNGIPNAYGAPNNITAVSGSGTVVTFTCANSFLVGTQLVLAGLGGGFASLNGGQTVATATSTQFTVTNTTTGATTTGTAQLYFTVIGSSDYNLLDYCNGTVQTGQGVAAHMWFDGDTSGGALGSANSTWTNVSNTFCTLNDPTGAFTSVVFYFRFADDIHVRDSVILCPSVAPVGSTLIAAYDYTTILNGNCPFNCNISGLRAFGFALFNSVTTSYTGNPAAPNTVREVMTAWNQPSPSGAGGVSVPPAGTAKLMPVIDPNQYNLKWEVAGGSRNINNGSTNFFTSGTPTQLHPSMPCTLQINQTSTTANNWSLTMGSTTAGTTQTLKSSSVGSANTQFTYDVPAGWLVVCNYTSGDANLRFVINTRTP